MVEMNHQTPKHYVSEMNIDLEMKLKKEMEMKSFTIDQFEGLKNENPNGNEDCSGNEQSKPIGNENSSRNEHERGNEHDWK